MLARQPSELAARFGADFVAVLRQASGAEDAPISPRRPAPDYVVDKRFAEPVATLEVIMPTLLALARLLIAAMEKSGKGARQLLASFFRSDGAVRTIMVEAGQPVTRTEVVERLFAEKLDALADPLDPGFGFDLIRLAASHTVVVDAAQRGFDSTAHQAEDVAALADTLSARLGARRVLRYLPQDSHLPERAALAQFTWRRVTHRIARAEGPERIAMEWWRAPEPGLTRDYFRIEDEVGARFWLYRDGLYGREVLPSADGHGQPRWYVHGLFA